MQHDTSLNLCMYFYRPVSNCLQQCSSDQSGEDSRAACGRGESKASLTIGRLQDTAGPGRSHGLFHTRLKTKWIRKPWRQTEVVDRAVRSQELVHNKLRNPILTPFRQWLSLQGFLLVNRAQWRSQGWVILSPATWTLPWQTMVTKLGICRELKAPVHWAVTFNLHVFAWFMLRIWLHILPQSWIFIKAPVASTEDNPGMSMWC